MRDGRVVLVSDYAGAGGSATGGAGHAVLDSLAALEDYGVDVRLVHGFGATSASRASRLGGTDLRADGVRGAIRAIYNSAAREALGDALADEDRASTVVILHQWTRYLSPAAIGLLTEFPMMVYMHDHFWACPNGAYYDFPAQRPCDRQPLGLRCVASRCDRRGRATKIGRLARHAALAGAAGRGNQRRVLLHLSDRAKRTISPLLPHERHAVLHNPLGVSEVRPTTPTDVRYDVGYFGRLEPEKGLLPLIDALRTSRRSGLFVGGGSLVDEIVRHPGLELREWQDRDTMADAMRSCRMIVLPSLWPETWGLIVPEAMAAGVPVVVSDRAGSAELVERFGGGRVFDPGVPGGLDAAISATLAQPPATPVTDWEGFRTGLSGVRHAERIVALAAARFGINLAGEGGAAPRGRASVPGSEPASLPQLAR